MNTSHLDGISYHMVHIDNIESLFSKRAILSKEVLQKENMRVISIALDSVQSLRDRIYIWSEIEKRYRALHSYVPFYFAKLTPMLYVQYANNRQHEIVFLELSNRILKEPGVIFTDGNAANQQLSKFGDQKVYIIPATSSWKLERRYSYGCAYGTNGNCSSIFADPRLLTRLNWEIIYNGEFKGDAEKKRIKHAEVLIPDNVPLRRLQGISTMSHWQAERVNSVARKFGLEGLIPKAVCRPDLYF